MSVERNRAVEWNGEVLTGWIIANGVPTKLSADRQTIHCHAAGFNDAVSWEIDRFRLEIFEKLVPFLTGRAAQ